MILWPKEIPVEFRYHFGGAGLLFEFDPLFLAAHVKRESGFRVGAENEETKARGLCQFMPGAWVRFGFGSYENAWNPKESIIAQARYLANARTFLWEKAGRTGAAWWLVAYFCGETGASNYKTWLDVPPQYRAATADVLQYWSEWLR